MERETPWNFIVIGQEPSSNLWGHNHKNITKYTFFYKNNF